MKTIFLTNFSKLIPNYMLYCLRLCSILGNTYGSSKDPIIVYEGENIRLRCAASGVPKPHVEWRRTDGQLIYTGTYQGMHFKQYYNHLIYP